MSNPERLNPERLKPECLSVHFVTCHLYSVQFDALDYFLVKVFHLSLDMLVYQM